MYLSIIIRNLNEAPNLEILLLSLQKQKTGFKYEIIVIDNESDDNSQEVAKKFQCSLYSIKREAFTYGNALNLGAEHCQGEIIMAISTHVVFLHDNFLDQIPNYFQDPNVAALRFVKGDMGEQIKSSLLFGPIKLKFSDDENFAASNWNNLMVNHCSAFRRSCWELAKFDEKISSSEDKLWALEVLKKGNTILYNVPCFYSYSKKLDRQHKIFKLVIDTAAKEAITRQPERFYSGNYFIFLMRAIKLEIRAARSHLIIYINTFKKLNKLRKSTKH